MTTSCLVTQRLGVYASDGPDDDSQPDWVPISGKVRFVPNVRAGDSFTVTDINGEKTVPAVLYVAEIRAGTLYHNDEVGIRLFAAGANSNPKKISYKAQYFGLTANDVPITLRDVIFEAIPGGEIDLTTVTPVAGTTAMTIWGSSTPAGLGAYIADAFTDAPVTVNNMAQGGEWAQHSAARMGAIRGVVEPVVIPASGSVPLTFVDFAPRTADYAMRPFAATIGGVLGLVDTTGNDTKFVRSTSGDAVTLTEQTEVIPIDGPQTREHVTLLGVGKNNLTQRSNIDLVMDHVDTMVNYLTPKYPRFLIIGHHHNTGLAGDDTFARPHVDQVNAYSRDTYGPLYFDTIGVYTDLDRWAAAGIAPTQADLDDMSLGNKPPSLAQDASHFNPAGYRMLATALREHMADLGWY